MDSIIIDASAGGVRMQLPDEWVDEEWFCVPAGKGLLLLKDRETGETREVMMGVNNLKTIKIEPGAIHAIKNIGQEDMVLIVYSNESFDPDDPDTFFEKILE